MTHRVLIVDDHPENLYLLRSLLQGHGHTVDEAADGAGALVKAQQHPPDLIISDLLMPVMDGYTLLRNCKAIAGLRGIPFVVYTATYTDPRDEKLALDLGADAFIVKPAEPDVLMAQLSPLLVHGRQRGQPSQQAGSEEAIFLKEYNETLVRKLEHKSLELERANRELTETVAHLRHLSRRVMGALEAERTRLARELHDQIGQVLTAVKLRLQLLDRQPAGPARAASLAESMQAIDAAIGDVRRLSRDLRPAQLDDLGLAAALRAHLEQQATIGRFDAHFAAAPLPGAIDPVVETTCFRIAQEALTNVLRHAGARTVWLELAIAGDALRLTLRDDGVGFEPAAARRAATGENLGLVGMEERAALAGGAVRVASQRGGGTTVEASFPLRDRAAAGSAA
jgi:signal transduction histidine kinase